MKIFSRSFLLQSLFILFFLLFATVLLIPPEESLGHIIRAVFLHAALVQTGLILFAVAGVFGLFSILKKNVWAEWTLAVQKAAVVIWTFYILSSMIVTYMAWGVVIAWEEPRVRNSAEVWFFSLIFLFLVIWIKNKKFTAVANVILAVVAWILIKSAGMIRHPLDPIGASDASIYKILFMTISLIILLMAVQLVRLFYKRIEHEK